MEYERLVKTLRSGRIEAEISLGQSRGGTWYYNTRVFRPFTDGASGEVRKSYLFGQGDMPHVINVATRAELWVTEQLENQTVVNLDGKEAA